MKIRILKRILCLTGSQRNPWSTGVMWSYFLVRVVKWAAEFWILWSLLSSRFSEIDSDSLQNNVSSQVQLYPKNTANVHFSMKTVM